MREFAPLLNCSTFNTRGELQLFLNISKTKKKKTKSGKKKKKYLGYKQFSEQRNSNYHICLPISLLRSSKSQYKASQLACHMSILCCGTLT